MGANTYWIKKCGTTARDVFDNLHEEAKMMYGNGSYNGTISTTSLGMEIELPKKYKKGSREDLYKLEVDFGELVYPCKWETAYANLGGKYYKAYTASWEDDKELISRKKGVRNIQRYSVSPKLKSNGHDRGTYGAYDTLGEAKREAKKLALKYGEPITIKQLRSDYSAFILGHMTLTTDDKEYKSVRNAKTKIYKPVHEFVFFVYAAS